MKVREGQLFIQKLLGVQGSQTVLEKNIKMQLDLHNSPQQKKRGRPKKGILLFFRSQNPKPQM